MKIEHKSGKPKDKKIKLRTMLLFVLNASKEDTDLHVLPCARKVSCQKHKLSVLIWGIITKRIPGSWGLITAFQIHTIRNCNQVWLKHAQQSDIWFLELHCLWIIMSWRTMLSLVHLKSSLVKTSGIASYKCSMANDLQIAHRFRNNSYWTPSTNSRGNTDPFCTQKSYYQK